jgi:hypothetical protein
MDGVCPGQSVEQERVKPALIFTLVAISVTAIAFFAKGLLGAEGMTLGIVGSLINLGALWGIIRLIGTVSTGGPNGKLGAFLTVLAFLMKMPIFIGMAFAARGLGPSATSCFLFGIALVYFAMIGWVLARR